MIILDLVPPAITAQSTALYQTEAELVEIIPYSAVEYRRYRLNKPSLPASGPATVSVFRTSAAWADPSLIKKTIYYFHSADGADDRQLRDVGAPSALANIAKTHSLDSVQIVMPAIENSFLSAAYDEWFENEVKPWAELKTQTTAATRWIAGVSMGGFVSLSKFLSNLNSYAGVAANAPGLITWDFYSAADTQVYSEQSGLPLPIAQYLNQVFAAAFKSRAEYTRRDPFALLAGLAPQVLADKEVYLDVGELDNLGLRSTTELLDQEILKRNPRRHSLTIVKGAKHDLTYLGAQVEATLGFMILSELTP